MKIKLLSMMLLLASFGFAQNNNAAINIEKEILKKAKKIGDPSVASSSIYRLIALEGDNSTYKDSLAYIYFSARQYAPCFMIASEVLEREPKHIEMLEMKAISLESLGAIDKAVEEYQKLYDITKINFHGYNVAKLQFSIKKYEDALKTIEKIEKLNDSGKYKVTFTINQNHNQQVELLAAIAYLKGLTATELNQESVAKTSYEKAIKIQPDFILAKEKLETLTKK